MILSIFTLNIIILFSTVLDLYTKEADRLFIFSIVRILFILPLLAGSYILTYLNAGQYVYPFFFNSENIFSLLWMVLAYRLYQLTSSTERNPVPLRMLFGAVSIATVTVAGYTYSYPSSGRIVNDVLVFPHYGMIYCSSFLLLMTDLLLVWRLESFWRSLEAGEKWRYKYLMIGLALVCAMLGWSSSYRIAYLSLPHDLMLLSAIVMIMAFLIVIFALARHRLLNRKLFVSRKVVYASITPMVFSGFFILVGIMSLLSRLFGWSVPFVLQWLIILSGVLSIIVFALSGSVRRQVKYFISTHFYINKYEYRDEWLAFSDLLQGKLTEKGVVEALYQILHDCMYTYTISIWLGDIQKGFHLINPTGGHTSNSDKIIHGDDPVVCYLHNAPYLYCQEGDADPLRRSILIEREAFLQDNDIVLMVPLILGNQCVGLIGLGPESTGGRYGHDDFDLLSALSSHATSALLAVQNAEKLAITREQSAWSNLSAFVLHDIKNAATLLELVRKNAPHHLEDPEFQQDMLTSIDDALKRMAKVQTRLSALKGEIVPNIRPEEIGKLLRSRLDWLAKKLPDLDISFVCPTGLTLQTDSDSISQILENLLINAQEAGGVGTAVRIEVTADTILRIDMKDNGPGIMADLLPQALFEPFKSAKPNGSGIGLWQVRQLVESLGGDIQAQNIPEGGACFTIQFPYRPEASSGN